MRISDWSSDVCSSDLFFPVSDRPEVLVEVQMPEGTGIEATSTVSAKVEAWIRKQPEAKIVTTYVRQGAPRFVLNISPELLDPSFAKSVLLTDDAEKRKESGRAACKESVWHDAESSVEGVACKNNMRKSCKTNN